MSTNSSFIIRLQNLPNEGRAQDIRKFFTGLVIPDGGVHVVGGEKGDAFIAFNTDEDARQAMMRKGSILNNPIKLFLSSRSEMSDIVAKARIQTTGLIKKLSESTAITTSASSNFHSSYYPNFSNTKSTPNTTNTSASNEMTSNTAQSSSSNNLANELAAILSALQSHQQPPPLLDTSNAKPVTTFLHQQQGNAVPSFVAQSGVGNSNQDGSVPNIQALLQLFQEKQLQTSQQQRQSAMPFHPPFSSQMAPHQRFVHPVQQQQQQSNGGWTAQSGSVLTNTYNHHPNVASLYQQSQQQLMSQQRSLPLLPDDNANHHMVLNSHSSESTTAGSNSLSSLYGPSSPTIKQQSQPLDEPYVKIKNIPLAFTYSDIKMFFNKYKLNLDDIKIINDQNGQRTGEIVLRLHSINDVNELLNLNGRLQCNNHYLDIKKIDEYTFASSVDSFIPAALSKKRALIPRNCVKVLHLHPKWDKREIKRYFNGCNVTRDRNGGIFFELDNNAMNRGPTYIEFEHEIDVEKAMFYNSEVVVGDSKIEVYRMTKSEMETEINNLNRRDRRRPPLLTHDGEPNHSSPLVLHSPTHRSNEARYTRPNSHYSNNSNNYQQQQIDHSSGQHQQNNYQPFLFNQQQDQSSITCLRLSNIPYTTTEKQIRDYFQSININIESCKFLNDKFGRQAGEAFVRFHDTQSCQRAYEKKQRQIFNGNCLDIRPLTLMEFNQNPLPLSMNEIRDQTSRLSNNMQQQQQKRPYYEERRRPYDDQQKRPRFNNGNHSHDDQRHTSSPIQNSNDLNSKIDYSQRAAPIRHNNGSSDPNHLSNLPPLPEHMEIYRGRILYLSNVAYRATREEILDLLKPFNPIEETLKIRCDSNGKPTGFAVVACAEPHDAQNAVSNLNNQTFMFRKIYLAQK